MTYSDLEGAMSLLDGVIAATPMQTSRWLSEASGIEAFLKCENFQRTGSFKVRGAYVRVARLSSASRGKGLIAASAGNHAQGVAFAAQQLRCRATVFMPVGASLPKVEATRALGAEVVFPGKDVAACLAAAEEYSAATGSIFVHPFDHADVIAGQGTIGLEILEALPNTGTIIVPIGGGGLAAGISLLRERRPDLDVVGVQMERAPSYVAAREHGSPLAIQLEPTISDGIAVSRTGATTFDILSRYLTRVVTVSEDDVARAVLLLMERSKLVVEPAGATTAAALLKFAGKFRGPVVCLLSGGNVDPLVLGRLLHYGLSSAGRYMTVTARLADQPGAMQKLLSDVAQMGLNVVTIDHDRSVNSLGIGEVMVTLELTTRGPDHQQEVLAALRARGY